MNKKYFILSISLLHFCFSYSQNRFAQVFITSKDTDQRLTKVSDVKFAPSDQPFENEVAVFIDPSHTFQTMVGIGGAITDASAETFYKLTNAKRKEFLDLYFDPEKGIGYTLARTNINSCDFSSDMYTYVHDGDMDLKSFDISHDKKYKIPMIKAAMSTSKNQVKLFASPWSPPAYMKSNNDMLQGGKLKPEYFETWSQYYVKFINSYKAEGVPIWGITVQNEPMAKQTWESCIYTAEEETNFIKNYLGPTLHKNKLKNVKLIAWDHNRDLIYQRASTTLNDKQAAKYVWGIGFHWYEIWNGGRQYDNVKRVNESFPNTNLMLTEACNYPFDWKTFDQWQWGENYGENMIQDFNNGSVAWTDWNILLDETGGPNHVNNFCFAPIHAKVVDNTIHLMNSYYYIGHFSKFIRPGAKRISASTNRAQLLTTAFKNTDGTIAVVVMNKTDEKFKYELIMGHESIPLDVAPHSIETIVYK